MMSEMLIRMFIGGALSVPAFLVFRWSLRQFRRALEE